MAAAPPGGGAGLLRCPQWPQQGRSPQEQLGSCSCAPIPTLPGARPRSCPALPSPGPLHQEQPVGAERLNGGRAPLFLSLLWL